MGDYIDYYKGKKVLVTGGAGSIGSQLTKKLVQIGAMVIVLDDLSSGYRWNLPNEADNLLFIQGSITDDIDLKRTFTEEPQIVFHLAAFFANQNSIDYPEKDLHTNGFGILKLLEYSSIYGNLERFVYASSGCSIYGDSKDFPLVETDISTNLSTPYQVTKMLGELYCNYFHKQYNLPTVKTRFFNSYGPGEVPGQYRNVIPNFIFWAMEGKPLPITGSGNETRDFTYVGDIIDGLLRAGYFQEAIEEEFNFCSGKEVEIGKLAKMINDVTGNNGGLEKKPRRRWDTKRRILGSYEKAKNLLGYESQMEFTDGLKNTVSWFERNWDHIKEAACFPPGISSAVREKAAQ